MCAAPLLTAAASSAARMLARHESLPGSMSPRAAERRASLLQHSCHAGAASSHSGACCCLLHACALASRGSWLDGSLARLLTRFLLHACALTSRGSWLTEVFLRHC